MSFTVNVNRLPELIGATKQVSNFGRNKRILAQAASESGRKLQAMYQQNAPEGSRWTEPNYESPQGFSIVHGRPSQRIFGSTLASSWGQDVELSNLQDGVRVTIGTMTDQIKYLYYGAVGHTIPIDRRLITFYHFKSGFPMFFGRVPFERAEVYHPGIARNLWIDEIWNARGRATVSEIFARAMSEVIQPFRQFFGA